MDIFKKVNYLIVLAICILFGGYTYANEPKNVEEYQIAKTEFGNTLNKFDALKDFFNIEDKKNLMWLHHFFITEDSGNASHLPRLYKAFRTACIKIETLTIQYSIKNMDLLIDDAVSELDAEKIKLQVLFDLCAFYKNCKIKSSFQISNNIVTKFVLRALPERFKLTWFQWIPPRLYQKTKNLVHLQCFLKQDFYQIDLDVNKRDTTLVKAAEGYLELTEKYHHFIILEQNLDIQQFVAQVDKFINELFDIATNNEYINSTIELWVAKLTYVKNLVLALNFQHEITYQTSANLKLFLKFKFLILSKNFGKFRTNKNFGYILDTFIDKMQKFFVTKDMTPAILVEFWELELLIKQLQKTRDLPEKPSWIFGMLGVGKLVEVWNKFHVSCEDAPLYEILGEMLEIVSESISIIITTISKNEPGVLSGGVTILNQLKKAGFDGTSLRDITGAFCNQKFNTVNDMVTFFAAKTSPYWLTKITPYLPDDIKKIVETLT